MQLYKYTGSVLASLPHPTFYQGSDQFVEGSMVRPKPSDGTTPSPPTINMWLYFWHMQPRNPNTIFHYPDTGLYDVHPGLNRFIGRGIKYPQGEWLDAIIVSAGEPYTAQRPGIRIDKLIDQKDYHWQGKDIYKLENRDVYNWTVLEHSPERSFWFENVPAWVSSVLGKYRAELVLASGRTVRLNPTGKRVVQSRVVDHGGFVPAVRHLFTEIEPIVQRSLRKRPQLLDDSEFEIMLPPT
jgi:hypothetical protein